MNFVYIIKNHLVFIRLCYSHFKVLIIDYWIIIMNKSTIVYDNIVFNLE